VSTAATALLTVHLFATAGMVGLIWFVQVVHYPLFARVGPDGFPTYETEHQRRTSWVVGPLMAVEGVAALAVAATLRNEVGLLLPLLGLVLLLVIHASTVLLQVPAHGRLTSGADHAVMRRLVATNWIRTGGWSARGAVAVAMLLVAVPT
jgi:hypothetical protein